MQSDLFEHYVEQKSGRGGHYMYIAQLEPPPAPPPGCHSQMALVICVSQPTGSSPDFLITKPNCSQLSRFQIKPLQLCLI